MRRPRPFTGQGDLFDAEPPPSNGTAERDDAIARVTEHASPDWLDMVVLVVAQVPSGHHITTDDVWRALGEEAEVVHEPRAMGGAMKLAQAAGFIVPVNSWRLSSRAVCHRRPMRVWRRL